MKNMSNFTQWKRWISQCDDHAHITHQKHFRQSGRSTQSALYIFNTLHIFTDEPKLQPWTDAIGTFVLGACSQNSSAQPDLMAGPRRPGGRAAVLMEFSRQNLRIKYINIPCIGTNLCITMPAKSTLSCTKSTCVKGNDWYLYIGSGNTCHPLIYNQTWFWIVSEVLSSFVTF